MAIGSTQTVIKGVRYFLGHAPGLVRHGFNPSREISKSPKVLEAITAHLRCFGDAAAYPPNRAFLGDLYPDELRQIERPWFHANSSSKRRQPHGEIMPEEELLGLLKLCDAFDHVWLEGSFSAQVRETLAEHPLITQGDLERLEVSHPYSAIEAQVVGEGGALPLYLKDGRLVGCVNPAGKEMSVLAADVMLENLACKATAMMALRSLLQDQRIDPGEIGYLLNCGEEAVGDAYQRGGGNLAKAIGEMCGLERATGADVKAFCCGPMHSLMMAATLVGSGLFGQVVVVGGGSLPKLGMNFQGHVSNGQPIIEDVLAGVAMLVAKDDGASPIVRLDSVGTHNIGVGSSLRAISRTLVSEPLNKVGLQLRDIDKYAIELQNPEITEPSGAGDVTERNYRLIGALAVQNHEIERSQIGRFVEVHGMPGFSSTQGHIASAIPFLGHALDRLKDGRMTRCMLVAKGSLFLGRMTQMSDGMSFIIERNPAA